MPALFALQAVHWPFCRWPLAHRGSRLSEVAAEVLAAVDPRHQDPATFEPATAHSACRAFAFQHLRNGSQMLESLSGDTVFADGHAARFGVRSAPFGWVPAVVALRPPQRRTSRSIRRAITSQFLTHDLFQLRPRMGFFRSDYLK